MTDLILCQLVIQLATNVVGTPNVTVHSQSFVLAQIMKATGIKGPQMKKVTENLLHWQLAHPDATKEDADTYLSGLQG